jgi:hypothetical protein
MARMLRPADFDFSDAASTAVVSDSYRFVLPVPAWADGGEPLGRPDGEPLVDGEGRPIEGRGLAWIDPDDRCWEVARGDGTSVILFSPMSESAASAILARIGELADGPAKLSVSQIREVIAFATTQPGVRAAYASTRAFVADAMSPADAAAAGGFGLHRRRADQVCRAVFTPGAGAFRGPAASAQLFSDGAVIVKHGRRVQLVQPASFEATYRFLDGRPARVAELATQAPA